MNNWFKIFDKSFTFKITSECFIESGMSGRITPSPPGRCSLHKFTTWWWNDAAKLELLWKKYQPVWPAPFSRLFLCNQEKFWLLHLYWTSFIATIRLFSASPEKSSKLRAINQERIQSDMKWNVRGSLLFHPSSPEPANVTELPGTGKLRQFLDFSCCSLILIDGMMD